MKNFTLKAFTLLALLTFILSIVMIIWNWSLLPNEVPTHYGINGEPDSWGNKWFVLFIPIIGLALWGFVRATKFFGSLNIPGVSNEKPANEAQKEAVNNMMIVISNILLLLISFISIKDTYNLLGGNISLGYWEVVIFFIAILLPIILYSIRITRLGKAK